MREEYLYNPKTTYKLDKQDSESNLEKNYKSQIVSLPQNS